MKLAPLGRACAAMLLLVACDNTPAGIDSGTMMGTDSGTMMGTEAGMMRTDSGPMMRPDAGPPDMNALMRQRAAGDRIRAATCGCDMAPFASAAECEAFGDLAARDACTDAAFTAQFAGLGSYFTCTATAYETLATCVEAASCGDTTACEDAADAAITACEAFVDETAAMAYGTAIQSCGATNIVGTGGTCPDDSGAISTTGMSVFTGSTLTAGNDLEPPTGCITARGGGGSPERALRWTAPAAGTYVFDTIGSSFDTVLYVRASCEATAMVLGCNDDLSMDDLRSRVTATLTMGQEVLVVVEGFSYSTAGDFVVNINAM